MSRRHQVIWVCDRCGFNDVVLAKSDTIPPEGWRQTETHQGVSIDLCRGCLRQFGDLFDKFLNEVKHPEVETRTNIDDELNELDPEVDDGA